MVNKQSRFASFLVRKLGIYRTRKRGEEMVFTCPECHRPKLEVNLRKGKFNCFRCKFSGSTSTLSRYLGLHERFKVERQTPRKEVVSEGIKPIEIPKYYGPLTLYHVREIKYLESRGLTGERSSDIGIGLSSHLDLQGRVIIPIKESGVTVSYVARAINDRLMPKEISPPGHISNKSNFLYNIDSISHLDTVVVTEGIFDCERVVSAGYKCVAIMGSNMSDVQIGKLLSLRPGRIILFLDGDEAGKEGTIRASISIQKRTDMPISKIDAAHYERRDPGDMELDEIRRLLSWYV